MQAFSQDIQPRYVSIKEWCRMSGQGMTSTYAALARGELTAIKMGRRTLVDVEAGIAWLRSRPAWRPSVPVAAQPAAMPRKLAADS